jgi:hypothetical protein
MMWWASFCWVCGASAAITVLGEAQSGRQRGEGGDSVALAFDLSLGHDSLCVVGSGQQVDRGVGRAVAAQGSAVHGQAGERGLM